MNVIVRLYRQHDIDLMAIYLKKGIKFSTTMKEALLAYARNEPYSIQIPDGPYKKHYLKKSIAFHIELDEETDRDAILLLKKVRVGMRNVFLKTLFRNYVEELPMDAAWIGSNLLLDKESALLADAGQAAAPKKKQKLLSKPDYVDFTSAEMKNVQEEGHRQAPQEAQPGVADASVKKESPPSGVQDGKTGKQKEWKKQKKHKEAEKTGADKNGEMRVPVGNAVPYPDDAMIKIPPPTNKPEQKKEAEEDNDFHLYDILEGLNY
jgi:hypothetical protein